MSTSHQEMIDNAERLIRELKELKHKKSLLVSLWELVHPIRSILGGLLLILPLCFMPHNVLLAQAVPFLILWFVQVNNIAFGTDVKILSDGTFVSPSVVPRYFPFLALPPSSLCSLSLGVFSNLIPSVMVPALFADVFYLASAATIFFMIKSTAFLLLMSCWAISTLPRAACDLKTVLAVNLTAALGLFAAFLPVGLASVARVVTSPAFVAANLLVSSRHVVQFADECSDHGVCLSNSGDLSSLSVKDSLSLN